MAVAELRHDLCPLVMVVAAASVTPNVRANATREAGRLARAADDAPWRLRGQGGLPRGVAC